VLRTAFMWADVIFFFLMWCEALHLRSPTRVYFLSHFFNGVRSTAFMETEASSFLLSERTHRKFVFCVAVISRMDIQKIFVQKIEENIEIVSLPFVFQSFVGGFVHLQQARQKGDF